MTTDIDRQRREDELRDVLRAAGLERIVNELLNLAWQSAVDEQDDLLRRIGWILVNNGHQDLWQLVYLEAIRDCTYVLGDECRFFNVRAACKPDTVARPLSEGSAMDFDTLLALPHTPETACQAAEFLELIVRALQNTPTQTSSAPRHGRR